jgi:hypothetical protein
MTILPYGFNTLLVSFLLFFLMICQKCNGSGKGAGCRVVSSEEKNKGAASLRGVKQRIGEGWRVNYQLRV